MMFSISATQAKQRFSEALSHSEQQPVAIQKHGKTVAVLASPMFFDEQVERRIARLQQELVEAARLNRHLLISVDLLKDAQQARKMIQEASQVVDQWERERLCSRDFIERWRKLLSLPVDTMAESIHGDMEGWGNALRQNSPWGARS